LNPLDVFERPEHKEYRQRDHGARNSYGNLVLPHRLSISVGGLAVDLATTKTNHGRVAALFIICRKTWSLVWRAGFLIAKEQRGQISMTALDSLYRIGLRLLISILAAPYAYAETQHATQIFL
jgi:hypothetical protein